MGQKLLFIDDQLRATFSELQLLFKVTFDQTEISRLFLDAENDQVSLKTYLFYKSSRWPFWNWSVTGTVDEYEPETAWLTIQGDAGKRKAFESFFARK
ncbi:hypothetical protein [Hymenobacter persicinus]|uniref:Uncharacterized protein n=1 Tax=Hymenobacter persicinus TaxID=2025506 RepID=A0A4Q5LEZ6_9BACT|nr:hypothetical protein [Hymenobacter persicinus]RYU83204.1 hypothetical protein EWM57_02655 [Hymenobacter persicinus]